MLKKARVDDYIREIRLEDIPSETVWLAESMGLDFLIRLCTLGGGCLFYIPKIESVCLRAKRRMVRAEFDGGNIRELAIRHGLTMQQVRNIIKADYNKESYAKKQ